MEIPRFIAERYIPDFYCISAKLGKRLSERFVKTFDSGFCWYKDNAQVENMTANKFFEYCRIAYLAAEEDEDHLDRTMSGREMYERYSDGRYGALLAIDPDSPEQFLKSRARISSATVQGFAIAREGLLSGLQRGS